jgi:hypothetical protein
VYIAWALDNRMAQSVTCLSQGLTTLNIQLYQGTTPFSSPVSLDCGSQPIGGAQGSTELYVTPGTYGVVVYGTDGSGNSYTSPTTNPATVNVVAGAIPASNCGVGTDGCVGQITVSEQ